MAGLPPPACPADRGFSRPKRPAVHAGQQVSLSPDGQRLAVRHIDGLVRLWDVATRKPLMVLNGDGYGLARLTFSKDGKWLVGGAAESSTLVVWDVAEEGG